MENYGWGDEKHGDLSHVNGFHLENLFGVHPFYINKGMPFMIYASWFCHKLDIVVFFLLDKFVDLLWFIFDVNIFILCEKVQFVE